MSDSSLANALISSIAGAATAFMVSFSMGASSEPVPDDAYRYFTVGDVHVIELQHHGNKYYTESPDSHFGYYVWFDAKGKTVDSRLRDIFTQRVRELQRQASDHVLQHRRRIITAADVSTQDWIK